MVKIIGLVGSNSDHSTNRMLLQFMQRHFVDQAKINLLEIKDLPVFNKSEDKKIPEEVQIMAEKIEAADGVVISTPEYDHSVPAALLNALHWLSYGIHPFVDKPVMITGASYGRLGTSRAQAHLRQVLEAPELKARVMPGSGFLLSYSLQAFDEGNNLKDREEVKKLEKMFTDFLSFVEICKQLNKAYAMNKKEVENFS